MSKVIIYRVSIHDLDKNEDRLSGRWMIRDGLGSMAIPGEMVIEATATKVDISVLDNDGLTAIGFNPSA